MIPTQNMVRFNCCVIGFICNVNHFCSHCGGDGEERPKELCQHCDRCFDEEIGWSTGIEPGTLSQVKAREFVKLSRSKDETT